MKVTVKKLWKGNQVSVRDYFVTSAIENHEDLVISFQGQEMVVPYADLHRGLQNSYEVKSKYPPYGHYSLIDFEWKPTTLAEEVIHA